MNSLHVPKAAHPRKAVERRAHEQLGLTKQSNVEDIAVLQHLIGNKAVQALVAQRKIASHNGESPSIQASPDNQVVPEARDDGLIQRSVLDGVLGTDLGDLADTVTDAVFDQVVDSNIAEASPITIPPEWQSIVQRYAIANPKDGAVLIPALARAPMYYSGGWIMNAQSNAVAMTLDRSIFVKGSLSLSTFVHELVHVNQYYIIGKMGFLAGFYGTSAMTIFDRWRKRQPLNVTRSSSYEEQAYQLEERFAPWYKSEYGDEAEEVTT